MLMILIQNICFPLISFSFDPGYEGDAFNFKSTTAYPHLLLFFNITTF